MKEELIVVESCAGLVSERLFCKMCKLKSSLRDS